MTQFKEAVKPLGLTVVWSEAEQAEGKKFVGTVLEGIYKGQENNVGKNNSNIYLVESKEHGLLTIWGTRLLDDKFSVVPIGSLIRLTYLGKKDSPGAVKPYHNFKLEYAEAPVNYAEAGINPQTAPQTTSNQPNTAGY